MIRREFIPHSHQLEMIEHAQTHPRCALWAGMGSGKTSAALTLLHELALVEPGRSLVLAPLRVARDTWPEEAAKWMHLRDMSVVPIVGTPAERVAALKLDVDCHTINYDVLPWLIEWHLDNKRSWRWSRVVADESTRLKNFRLRNGGVQAQAIAKVAHTRVKRWINLTGTPSPNGLKDLWGQTWFLDSGMRLGRTMKAFEDRWFRWSRKPNPIGPNYEIAQELLPSAEQQIHAAVADICITPTLPWPVEQPLVRKVYVDLPAKARRHYDEMERAFFSEIEGNKIEALTAAAKSIKCLQLANGAAYLEQVDGIPDDKRKWVETHDEKLQALHSIVEEAAGMPVLVAYHFKSDRARIMRAFPKAVDVATAEGMAAFKTGRVQLGVGHPASMGHGIDGLQDVTHICAIFGRWWDLEKRMQFIERIGPTRQKQSGYNRHVFVYEIIARYTVDELVIARHETKREVQDILLEAARRRKNK